MYLNWRFWGQRKVSPSTHLHVRHVLLAVETGLRLPLVLGDAVRGVGGIALLVRAPVVVPPVAGDDHGHDEDDGTGRQASDVLWRVAGHEHLRADNVPDTVRDEARLGLDTTSHSPRQRTTFSSAPRR